MGRYMVIFIITYNYLILNLKKQKAMKILSP